MLGLKVWCVCCRVCKKGPINIVSSCWSVCMSVNGVNVYYPCFPKSLIKDLKVGRREVLF